MLHCITLKTEGELRMKKLFLFASLLVWSTSSYAVKDRRVRSSVWMPTQAHGSANPRITNIDQERHEALLARRAREVGLQARPEIKQNRITWRRALFALAAGAVTLAINFEPEAVVSTGISSIKCAATCIQTDTGLQCIYKGCEVIAAAMSGI